jgi:hypothetical protein
MLEILGSDEVEIELIVKGQRIGNVHINGIAVHARFGIGVPSVNNGIFHFLSP